MVLIPPEIRNFLAQVDVIRNAYHIESIFQVTFFRGKLLFQTYQVVQMHELEATNAWDKF